MTDEQDQTERAPATPLLKAILLEDPIESTRQTRALLEAGEDPNEIDTPFWDCPPLYIAWSETNVEGKPSLVQLMLNHGAKAVPDEDHLEGLYMLNAPIEATLLIFEAGHSFKEYLSFEEGESIIRTGGGNPLTFFLEQGRFDLIEQLRKYDLMDLIDAFEILTGWTPLNEMARDGDLKKTKWLLDQGADVNANSELWAGYTALDEAVSFCHLEIVKLLLEAGANPNIPTWMSNTVAERVQDGYSFTEKPDHDPAAFEAIRSLVLEASKTFPPKTLG